MKLIDAVGLKIRLGKRYAYDERRIREIFKETIDDMPTIEAIPIQFLKDWSEQYEYDETIPRTIPLVLSAWEYWRKQND